MMTTLLIQSVLKLALISQVALPELDPALQWRTIETEHFYFHYDAKLEKSAQKLAPRAEWIYAEHTKAFRWEPQTKVQVVIADNVDSPNGLSTPLPYNTIYLYAVPPLDDSTLDDYDDWLLVLFAHEFTHTVHLDMATGVGKIPRYLLGRFWLPNAPQQQWVHEGLAIYFETRASTKGRGRSSFIDMYIRTVSLEDHFAPIDRATYWNDYYPFGNTAYWYGIGFHQYLAKHFSEEKIIEMTHTTAGSLIPGFFNFKTDDVYGKSFHRLWSEWKAEEKDKWTKFAAEYPSHQSFTSIHPLKDRDHNVYLNGQGVWDPETKKLYAPIRQGRDSSISSFTVAEDGTWKQEVVLKDVSPARITLHGGKLVYSDIKPFTPWTSGFDLYVYDLKDKKSQRITKGLRLRDPLVVGNRLIGIRTDRFESALVAFPWDLVEKAYKDKAPIEGLKYEVLYRAKGFDALSKPTAPADGSRIAFSMKKENANRDLYLLDLNTKVVSPLTDDPADDHMPVFSADGQKVIYSADHLYMNSQVRIPNIYEVDVNSKSIKQVTSAITGMNFPVLFNSDKIFVGDYESYGWLLGTAPRQVQDVSAASLGKTAAEAELKPKVFEESAPLASQPYHFGNALLPRYLIPFFLYTEKESVVALATGSRDPLGIHNWGAFAYQLFGPNRPGGALSYSYNGFRNLSLFAAGYSTIGNYGEILLLQNPTTRSLYFEDYYERTHGGTLGMSSSFYGSDAEKDFMVSLSGFFEKRFNEFEIPSNTVTRITSFSGLPVRYIPEKGQTWGGRFSFTWENDVDQPIDGIAPNSGQIVTLGTEYTPQTKGSDFHTLTTTLSGRVYQEIIDDTSVALRLDAGMQWLDPLYQRSFLLGGSYGQNPLASLNRRNYALRGLPISDLRGEGMVLGSLEFRIPLIRHLGSFGTAPIWFKNLHLGVFNDTGQTFAHQEDDMLYELVDGTGYREVKKFAMNRFTTSVGAELRSDMSVIFAPPIQYRLGYARVLFRQGEKPSRRIDEVYFQVGTSF